MSKIFDNIVDVENYLGVPVFIPSGIPEDTSVICYGEDGEHHYLYKENQDSLQTAGHYIGRGWIDTGSKSLEEEVEWDVRNGYKFAYLRLATKDNSDVFTPERLLGVKSNKGFVTAVYQYKWNREGFVVDFDGEGQYQPSAFKYYISDDSDETVSFEEYVGMFYEG